MDTESGVVSNFVLFRLVGEKILENYEGNVNALAIFCWKVFLNFLCGFLAARSCMRFGALMFRFSWCVVFDLQ